MKDWPCPKTLKGLHGFLGLEGHYKKFLKNYGKIENLLTTFLKNNAFNWNEKDYQDL